MQDCFRDAIEMLGLVGEAEKLGVKLLGELADLAILVERQCDHHILQSNSIKENGNLLIKRWRYRLAITVAQKGEVQLVHHQDDVHKVSRCFDLPGHRVMQLVRPCDNPLPEVHELLVARRNNSVIIITNHLSPA